MRTRKTISKTAIIYSILNKKYNMIEYNRIVVNGYLFSYRSASKLLTKLRIDHIDIDQLDRFSLDNK